MKRNDARTAGADCLEELMSLQPDSIRSELLRARCHHELQRRLDRKAQADKLITLASRLLPLAALGGTCVFYAAVFLSETLRLEGLLE